MRRRDRPSPTDLSLTAEAALLLYWFAAMKRRRPFPSLTRRLGRRATLTEAPAPADDDATAAAVGRAVARASNRLPGTWLCLEQTLAAQSMLRRRRIACTTYFGASAGGSLSAHAWLASGSDIVVGASQASTHRPVLAYAFDPLQPVTGKPSDE